MTSLQKASSLLLVVIFVAGTGNAYPGGIGGDANGQGEVSLAGCTCHAEDPDNSVTVILDGVPFHYSPETEYEMSIQLIGGPEINSESHTGGFAMTVSSGTLGPTEESQGLVQNWEGGSASLTHTDAGSRAIDRTWVFIWTSPAEGAGSVSFAIAGNSVNGDLAPSSLDRWNRLTASVDEGDDNGRLRTVFSGNGDITPPAPLEEHTDLHHMGAKLKAHWLGLLGFAAVILVILFCGLFLRYGFSRHYAGRSNLLRLRIKHLKRGDQL
jgi:hypothetical protein|tara:strand:+ start:3712 stop:4515 length:804 start_codon:yes stop_codon:yes gene_type:complete